jgi:hypothetical protein
MSSCDTCRELQGAAYIDDYNDLQFSDQLDSYWSKGKMPETYWKIAYKTDSGDHGDFNGLQTWLFCSEEHGDKFVSRMVTVEGYIL